MLVELKMIKRQDLVAIIAGLMKPTQDQVHIKVEISKDSMDSFVFCVGVKKTANKMFKELADLVSRCQKRIFAKFSRRYFHFRTNFVL
jgi:Protein of unknown function (DUF1682)